MIPQPPCASIAKGAELLPKFTASLRDFYGTFTTFLPPLSYSTASRQMAVGIRGEWGVTL